VNKIIKFWFPQKAGNGRLLDSEKDFLFMVRVAVVRGYIKGRMSSRWHIAARTIA
jgi:hypothetical protein